MIFPFKDQNVGGTALFLEIASIYLNTWALSESELSIPFIPFLSILTGNVLAHYPMLLTKFIFYGILHTERVCSQI